MSPMLTGCPASRSSSTIAATSCRVALLDEAQAGLGDLVQGVPSSKSAEDVMSAPGDPAPG